ncbi:MAG: formimidoylglutamate deiminase, partial [Phycisphaerales bacterium]
MTTEAIIEADLTWTGKAFESGVRIKVDAQGRVEAVGDASVGEPTLRLRDRALLPGFVNAHSHAFQRGLRGRGETFPAGQGDFWLWREAMYELVEQLDEERLYALTTQAYREMLDAGITTVGEFHYLHHDGRGDNFAFDEVVLRAAKDVGIRIVLLNAFYFSGGFNETGHTPLAGGQQRFATRSLDGYWLQMDRLAKLIDPATQSLGVVAHSIRAVPVDALQQLHAEAARRGLVFHMHLEEQPREIEECIRHYGRTPMALVNDHLEVSPLFTAVHATHTNEADMEAFLDAGGNVCLCPLTEANLGDGLANVPWILKHGGHLALGSDSNARISMLEEARWMEYGQRLAHQMRGVCRDDNGAIATTLMSAMTVHGA